MSRCSSCNASIRWAETQAGKKMPLDALTSARGNVRLERATNVATVLAGNDLAEARARFEPLHLSHFASCPRAAAHRSPKT